MDKHCARIWVVEMCGWLSSRGAAKTWRTTVGVALTREDGRLVLKSWRLHNPNDKFRIRLYIRKEF